MKHLLLLSAVWVALLCGCNRNKPSGPTAEELTDRASRLIEQMSIEEDTQVKDSLIGAALADLDQAIAKDSTCFRAYLTKANLLGMRGQYAEAIVTLERELAVKPFPEVYFVLGVTHEKLKDTASATVYYKQALAAYDEQLQADSADDYARFNRDFMLIFAAGREEALRSVDERLKAEPGNEELLKLKTLFEEFNRDQFVTDF